MLAHFFIGAATVTACVSLVALTLILATNVAYGRGWIEDVRGDVMGHVAEAAVVLVWFLSSLASEFLLVAGALTSAAGM